jgi:hypothetical protein
VRSTQGKLGFAPLSRPCCASTSVTGSSLKQRPAPSAVHLATSAPRPGLPPEHQQRRPSKARKPPGPPNTPRPLVAKHGKATQRAHAAKRGGTAKPAKMRLPKLAALPTPIPGRRTLGATPRASLRTRTASATAQVASPTPAAAQMSSAASGPAATPGEPPGEDDAPGIDAAGARAGGGHRQQAQTAAPQATEKRPPRPPASHRAEPAVTSPEKPPLTRAYTRAHEPARARRAPNSSTHQGRPPSTAAGLRIVRTLRSWEQA